MATILHKRGTSTPTNLQVGIGELAINTTTGQVFTQKDDLSVVDIGAVAGNVITTVGGQTINGDLSITRAASIVQSLAVGTGATLIGSGTSDINNDLPFGFSMSLDGSAPTASALGTIASFKLFANRGFQIQADLVNDNEFYLRNTDYDADGVGWKPWYQIITSKGGQTIDGDLSVTGDLTTVTQSPNDNSTKVATTAYADAVSSGLADAVSDGVTYGRRDSAWVEVIDTLGGQSISGTTTLNDLNVTTNIDAATLALTGNLTTTGLIDTRDVAADGVIVDKAITTDGGQTIAGTIIYGTTGKAIRSSSTTNAAIIVSHDASIALELRGTSLNANQLYLNSTDDFVGIGKIPTNGELDVSGTIWQNGEQVIDTSGGAVTGTLTAPTRSPNDNSTDVATTAYVDAASGGSSLPTELANHTRGGYTQIVDGDTSYTFFSPRGAGVPFTNTFESIGPTGAGANNTWTTLDMLPAGTTHIIVDVKMRGIKAATSEGFLRGYWAKGGITPGTINPTRHLVTELIFSENVSTDLTYTQQLTIPVDSTKQFQFAWFQTNLTTGVSDIAMYYKGFISE